MNLNNTLKQHHKTMVVAGCGLLLFGAIKQPTMTAYASEAGGPGVSTTQQSIQQSDRWEGWQWLFNQFMVPRLRWFLVHVRFRWNHVFRPRNRPVNRQELPAQHTT